MRSALRQLRTPQIKEGQKKILLLLCILLGIFLIFISSSRYLGELTSEIALHEAKDEIVFTVNQIIQENMAKGNYDYNSFVNLQKDKSGNITALTTNMSYVNALSSEITSQVVAAAGRGELDIEVPMGNLSGSNLLSGRGPNIPIKVVMLATPIAEFRNELLSAGINQTKHQILLTVTVEVNILVPWGHLSEQIATDILVAETVIVGKVPDSYVDFNYGEANEYTGRNNTAAE